MPTDVRATGKSRSQRINIDYYRQKTWLTRSRGWLALLALLLAGGYCFYVYGSGGASHLSTGPLAIAHAGFENDCKQCHLDFTPISGDALKLASSSTLDRLETACQKCHRADHHFRGKMKPEFAAIDQHCSGCHTDHLGRDHSMVNLASSQCTQCHANLPETCSASSGVSVRPQITSFNLESHGDFNSLYRDETASSETQAPGTQSTTKVDPGRVKFDHAQHMLPGQVDADKKGGFTIAMLDPALRENYRELVDGAPQSDESLVTLQCADCHQLAGVPHRSQASGIVQVGDSEIGRHIEPIAFDRHCAACHAMTTPGQTEGALPLPHAAPWKEVEVLMASKLAGNRLLDDISMPIDQLKKTPRLGESKSTAPAQAVAKSTTDPETLSVLQAALQAGQDNIKKRCEQCHLKEDLSEARIDDLIANRVPPLIPERWLSRGIYDHAAHRKIDCAFCHSQAYRSEPASTEPVSTEQASIAPASSETVTTDAAAQTDDSQVVMIRGIESCSGCHRPSGAELPAELADPAVVEMLGGQNNWASEACTECHRYHWEPPAAPKPPAAMANALSMPEESPAL